LTLVCHSIGPVSVCHAIVVGHMIGVAVYAYSLIQIKIAQQKVVE